MRPISEENQPGEDADERPFSSGTAAALPSGARAWVHASRVPTLPAAVVPVLVGCGLAIGGHRFRPLVFMATLLAALLIQIGTNLANDYFDFINGADTTERLGPMRITSAGVVAPKRVLNTALLSFSLALVLGLYLVVVGGWPILLIGAAAVAAGMAYTAGPFPLGYHGLGDLFCFVFFGLVAVSGTYYPHTVHLSSTVVMASLPVACLVTAILVVNNIRDIDTDRSSGKLTLAVLLGRRGTRIELVVLLAVGYASLLVLAIMGASLWWLFWLPLMTLPLTVRLVQVVCTRVDGGSLNLALKRAATLHLLFGALLTVALAVR